MRGGGESVCTEYRYLRGEWSSPPPFFEAGVVCSQQLPQAKHRKARLSGDVGLMGWTCLPEGQTLAPVDHTLDTLKGKKGLSFLSDVLKPKNHVPGCLWEVFAAPGQANAGLS